MVTKSQSQCIPSSWSEIESFYIDLITKSWPLQDILPLIEYIKTTDDLSKKLFACTSVDKLIISIYNPIELNREALHIWFDKDKKLWNFEYHAYPFQPVEHERNYPGDVLIDQFQHYINLLKWQ